ncbi:MAG: PA14 domain-containing protein [Verrucomicrobiae bacterium]|nr:PA14 domain-containing protein [Verrucomicrobiae bacterium]
MKTNLLPFYLRHLFGILSLSLFLAPHIWAACLAPPAGSVGWWPAEGWPNDLLGRHPNVMQDGATFATGKVGRAFYFDGANATIEPLTQPLTNIANTFTLEFWAYPTRGRNTTTENTSGLAGTSGQRYAVAPESVNLGTVVGAGVSVGTNGVSVFEHGTSYLPSLLVFDTNITDWVHIAVVYQNKQPRLYLNGVLVRTGLTSTRATVFPSKLFGGVSSYGYYGGWLDEVTIYDRALSDTEIEAIYQADAAGKCRPDPAVPPEGMLAWWTGDRHPYDVVGTNPGALSNGVTYAVGVNDYAFSLDGVNDFVAVGALGLGQVFSLEGWFRPTILTNDMMLICRDDFGEARSYYLMLEASGALVGSVVNSNNLPTQYRTTAGTVSAGNWQHVVWTYNGQAGSGQKMKFYVNGAAVTGTAADGQDHGGTPAALMAGARLGANLGGGQVFRGQMDEVAVYGRGLGMAEVQAVYQAGFMNKFKPNPYDVPFGAELWVRGNAANGNQNLQRAGFNNAGTVRLQSTDGGYTSALTVNLGALTNSPLGVVNIEQGSGGSRYLYGDLVNRGTFNVNYGITFSKAGGVYENQGTFNIASGRELTISGQNQVFRQVDGLLNIQGALTLNNVSMSYLGGAISGSLHLINSRLWLGPEATNAASFIMTGSSSTWSGDIKEGQSIWVRGSSVGSSTTITVTNGFRNAGTLMLQSVDGGYTSALAVGEGVLTNMAAGVININPGTGGPRTVSASLLNLGTVNINYGTTFSKAGGVYENQGTFNIASGQGLSLSGQNQVFRQADGELKILGGLDLDNVTFDYVSGRIQGTPLLVNSRLFLGAGAVNAASFTLTGSGSTWVGDIKPGQSIWVQGSGRAGNTTVVVTNGFENSGLLTLQSVNGGYISSLTVNNGTLTNRLGGTIAVNGGNGGPRTISANLLNEGLLSVNTGLTLSRANGVYENLGYIFINNGGSISLSGQNQIFRQRGGSITNLGTLDLTGVQFLFEGGGLYGNAIILENVRLDMGAGAASPCEFQMTGSGSRYYGDLKAGQLLWVQGSYRGGHTTLIAPEGFRNEGTIRLQSSGSSFVSSLSVTNGVFTNAAGGVLEINGGSGGSRDIYGHLLNEGVIQVNYHGAWTRPGAELINRGTINIANNINLTLNGAGQVFNQEGIMTGGGRLVMSGGNQILNQNGGTLALGGGLDLTGVAFNFVRNGATAASGPVVMENCRLVLGPEAASPCEFQMTGSGNRYYGDLKAGQLLWVQGSYRGGHTTVIAPEGFRNEGTIRLQSTGSSFESSLSVTNGVLTNAASGVVEIVGGSGGARVLSANLVNEGLMAVYTGLTLSKANGIYNNRGRLYIDSTGSLTLNGQNQVFRQRGGGFTNSGSVDLTAVTFVLEEGGIPGNALYMQDCRLEIGPQATGPANFILTGSGSRYYGDLKAGQVVWVQGNYRGGYTTVIAPEGFRNEGTIRLQSSGSSFESSLSVTNGVFTNAAGGVVEINRGTGGARNIAASILNAGQLWVNYSLNCSKAGAGFLNEGRIIIASGQTLTIASPMTQVGGALELNGGTVDPGDSLLLQGGVLLGNGTVAGQVTNTAGRVAPGTSAGTLTINGNYSQGPGGTLEIELGGANAGSEYDQLVVNGTAELNGRLVVTLINNFVPTNGQSFTVLTASLRKGAFTELQLPTLPGGLTWEILHQPASVVVRVAEALPEGDARITGTVRNSAGLPLTNLLVTAYSAQTNFNGLRGDYYDNKDFTAYKFSRLDATVDFNWGAGAPDSRLEVDTFSVRWSGTVTPLYTETYTFYTVTDDGVRLWVNGQQIISYWADQGATERASTGIALTSGVPYEIVMEYYDNAVYATARLLWSSPSQPKQVIPATQLAPSSTTNLEYTTSSAYARVVETTTDAQGQFSLLVYPSMWQVNVFGLPSLGYAETTNRTVVIASSPTNAVVDFVAQPFTGEYYNILAQANPPQGGSVNGSGTYPGGGSVTLTALPNTNAMPYYFVSWTEGGVVASSNAVYTFTVARDRQLLANFALPRYAVTVSNNPSGAGSVSGAGTYTHGTTVTLSATPSYGYRFSHWSEGGTVLSSNSPYSFTATRPTSVTANYAEAHLVHVVTTATSPAGLANVAGAGVYTNGETTTISAPVTVTNPPNLYTFVRFRLNGTVYGAQPEFQKTFNTTDNTNMHFVAEYSSRPLAPQLAAVWANFNNPVPATTDLALSVRFDRSMNTGVQPLLVFTNLSGMAAPQVPANGTWTTTYVANDTYRTPAFTVDASMNGTNRLNVSLARATDNQEMTPVDAWDLVVDGTFPTITNINAYPGAAGVVITWQTDEPATRQVEYGLTVAYGNMSTLGGTFATAHSVSIGNLAPETTYHYRVRSRDRAGNETISEDKIFTTLAAPDLIVTNLTLIPTNGLASSGELTIYWEDLNVGAGRTETSWQDWLVISNLDSGERLLNVTIPYNAGAQGHLTNGAWRARQYVYQLPDGPRGAGTIGVRVMVDTFGEVVEVNTAGTAEQNNSALATNLSALAPYPDLAVSNLVIAPPVPQSGGTVTVSWAVANVGEAAVGRAFRDRLILRNTTAGTTYVDTTLLYDAAAQGAIPPGAMRLRQHSFRLPDGGAGVGELRAEVTVDSQNAVFEYMGGYDAETNNAAVATATAVLAPYPDLAVAAIASPAAAPMGQTLFITITLTNQGDGLAAAPWNNAVALASDPTGAGAQVLGMFTVTNPLPPGAALVVTQQVILPPGLHGTRYWVITADSGNQVFELDNGNNVRVAETPVQIQAADLVVEAINVPASAVYGQPFEVTWTVRNAGTAAASGSWRDRLYYATSPSLAFAQPLLDRTTDDISPLAAGATYLRQASVVIPFGATLESRTYYLIVVTDFNNRQPESNDGNNSRIPSALTVTAPPLPDLAVTGVQAPLVGVPGQPVELVWTVTNVGNAAANGPWVETVYVSGDDQIGGDLSVASFTFTNSLAAGEFVTRTQAVTLPGNTFIGNLYFVVSADSSLLVREVTEGNNTAVAPTNTYVPARLGLTAPVTRIAENSPNPALRLTVSRNGPLTNALTVTLSNSHPSRLVSPPQVVIAAGQAAASFEVLVIPDGVAGPDVEVHLMASAPDYLSEDLLLRILNSDRRPLYLQPATTTVTEGQSITFTVRREALDGLPLQVNLESSAPAQLVAPAQVVIPSNSLSVTFGVLATDDQDLEPVTSYTLTAAAAGFSNAVAQVVVQDNDIPTLQVAFAAPSVGEGIIHATTLTITRTPVTAFRLNVELQASLPGQLIIPATVTLPANVATLTLPVSTVDNAFADGTRQVAVTAHVLDAAGNRLATGGSDTLEINDDDGNALQLTLARSLVAEGLSPATTGTVTRNTATNEPLDITLTSSRNTEATVPGTVTIPAGQRSVTFPINTLEDGVSDGNQTVLITAAASGFALGRAALVVSDVNLPDLVVPQLIAPTNGLTETTVPVSFRVLNQGVAVASGSFVQRVWLSRDPLPGSDDLLMGEFPFTGQLPVGMHIEQVLTITLPRTPGDYYVLVTADAGGQINETLENNNTAISTTPIRVAPAFTATVQTDVETALADTAVPLYGTATKAAGGPAPFEAVSIHIYLRETRRTLAALTDANGQFTAVFQPLPGEGGVYRVGAAHPAATDIPIQDQFTLLGLRLNPDYVHRKVLGLETITGTVRLENLADVDLHNLTAQLQDVPAGLSVQVMLTNALPGLATATLTYTIQSLEDAESYNTFAVRLLSQEGANLTLPMYIQVEPRRPRLQVQPAVLMGGMVRGEQRVVGLEVANVGGAPTGPLSIMIPEVPWLRVVSTNPLPNLEPGQTSRVELLLMPAADLPLAEYQGSIVLAATLANNTIPFNFRCLSDAVGDLRILTVDELSYHGDNPRNLAGAKVVLRDPFTGAVVASGVTDTNGIFDVFNLREGTYHLEATADRHDRTLATLEVKAGQRNEQTIFLRLQLVRYNWTVEEIEIEDRTRITLETVYEAFVPTPVVTVEPSVIDLAGVTGEMAQIDLKISNHGLIAARDVVIKFPEHERWIITPLISGAASIPANSSMTVPVIIQRRPPETNGLVAANPRDLTIRIGDCTYTATIEWRLICGPFNIAYPVPIPVINATGNCFGGSRVGGPASGGSGTGWWRGGLGSWGDPGVATAPGQPQLTIYTPTPSVTPSNKCACVKSEYQEECLKYEAGLKAEIAGALTKAINAALASTPLSVKSIEVSFNVNGQLCTCCEDDLKGLKASVGGSASVTATLVIGYNPEASGQVNIPGLGAASYEASFLAGAEITLSGSVSGSYGTECHMRNPKLCLGGSVSASGVAGLRGKVDLTHERNGRTYKGGGTAFAGVTVGATVSIQGCTPGGGIEVKVCLDPVVFKVNVEGSIEVDGLSYSTSTGYERQLLPGGCYPPEGDGVVRLHLPDFGLAAQPTAGEMAQVLGFRHAEGMVQDLTGRRAAIAAEAPASHLAAALQSARSPTGTAALFTAPFRRSQVTVGWAAPRPAAPPVGSLARAALPPAPLQNGVCAQVRLQIDQEAVMTRKAIGATLDIFNDSNVDPLQNLNVTLSILDPNGNLANHKFVILPPELTDIEPVSGSADTNEFTVTRDLWRMPPASTGRARWIILPRDEAAPETPVVYSVGGIMTYSAGGVPGSAILLPSPVTVYPNPKLILKYFHQRDVMSDDPFTPEVEPAEPFTLAVMVQNVGKGIAKKFSITSAQPKIIENEKGLQIDFSIIATEVAGKSLSPSLTAVFGDIGPNQIVIGRWLMKASLLGFFVDYRATFEHENTLGGRETSLIDSVEIHEMIRQVQAAGPLEDGRPDFLVNDVKDDLTLPDVIYLSDGSTGMVAAVTSGVVDQAPGPGRLVVTLTAPMPGGWAYLRVPDPADGQYVLTRVERSDGGLVPLNTNVWVSRYTFTKPGVRPTRENVLHLLDYNSPGVYYLHYTPPPRPDTNPPTSRVAALPPASFPQIPVSWSGTDAESEIHYYDVFVSLNDGPFVPWLQRTRQSGAVYQGAAGQRYAFYCVATDTAGNTEPVPLTPQAVTTVSLINTPPQLAALPNVTLKEGETLQVAVIATDADMPAQQLVYSLGSGTPPGVSIHPQSGALTWLTGESHGGTTNRIAVVVTDNGVPAMSATQSFVVVVREVNQPPVVPALIDRRVDAGQIIGFLVGASDPDIPANTLTYSLENAPAGATLHPTTGLFQWTPSLAQSPSTNVITVRVTDNGTPNLSAASTFMVIVNRPNQPPNLAVPADQVIDEGNLLLVSASASDADVPAQQLAYSLVNPPAGATIHPVSGIISWTPAEAQGPSTNTLTVKVTDNGSPPQSATRSFTVIVNEVNSAPVWPSLPLLTAAPRRPLTNQVAATDADLPPNQITYRLAAGSPVSASINASNGMLVFLPGAEHAGRTNWLPIVATDSGQPPLSATTLVAVAVSDMMDLAAGQGIVPAGQSGRIPLNLFVSSPLTNLGFTLQVPSAGLTNFMVTSSNAALTASPAVRISDMEWRFTLEIRDASLVGTQEFAALQFDVLPQASAAIIPLNLQQVSAQTIAGQPVPYVWTYPGRAIVVGAQPLLNLSTEAGQVRLLLYELPGTTLQLQTATRLEPPPPWQNWMRITVTNYQTEVLDLMSHPAMYYRAFRTNAP